MVIACLVISILALACSIFSIFFKKVGPQGPQGIKGDKGEDGVSVLKEAGDITGEDIVKLLSQMDVINLGKAHIKCDGFYDLDV